MQFVRRRDKCRRIIFRRVILAGLSAVCEDRDCLKSQTFKIRMEGADYDIGPMTYIGMELVGWVKVSIFYAVKNETATHLININGIIEHIWICRGERMGHRISGVYGVGPQQVFNIKRNSCLFCLQIGPISLFLGPKRAI